MEVEDDPHPDFASQEAQTSTPSRLLRGSRVARPFILCQTGLGPKGGGLAILDTSLFRRAPKRSNQQQTRLAFLLAICGKATARNASNDSNAHHERHSEWLLAFTAGDDCSISENVPTSKSRRLRRSVNTSKPFRPLPARPGRQATGSCGPRALSDMQGSGLGVSPSLHGRHELVRPTRSDEADVLSAVPKPRSNGLQE